MGLGYMTEMLKAIQSNFSYNTLGMLINSTNAASIKIAEKLSFTLYRIIRGNSMHLYQYIYKKE
jgi:RimJ/RimL family protein N-acetyltransferase